MTISAQRLRTYLQRAIDRLDELDEDAKVKMVTNTYFLGDCNVFLGISGYSGGYVNLDRIEEDAEDYEE